MHVIMGRHAVLPDTPAWNQHTRMHLTAKPILQAIVGAKPVPKPFRFPCPPQNLSTQSLLLALGMGAKKTIAASAAINWWGLPGQGVGGASMAPHLGLLGSDASLHGEQLMPALGWRMPAEAGVLNMPHHLIPTHTHCTLARRLLKDGVGRIARMTVATNFGQSFDSDLKRIRYVTSCVFEATIGCEFITPFFPQACVPLAPCLEMTSTQPNQLTACRVPSLTVCLLPGFCAVSHVQPLPHGSACTVPPH